MAFREKCAIVVGASSGIGAAVARRLARRGFRVALVARRAEALAEVVESIARKPEDADARPYVHDVRQFADVPALFDRIVEDLGGLDLIVYAAGVMSEVGAEEYSFDKDRAMVETNLLGMMAWLNQAADLFARLQRGVIVGVGSIAGDRGRKGSPAYNTSKGAQAVFLESLRNRLDSRGVRVVTIKPGYVATAMTAGMGNLLWMISADEAARRIIEAAARSRGEVYVPRRWRLVGLVIKHIPSFIFRKLGI